MLSFAGRPFLEVLIQEAARFGFEQILLLAGRFGEQIRDRYDGREMYRARIRVLVEPAPLGTAGALRFAVPALDPAFLLMNGDSWLDTDLTRFAFTWTKTTAAAPNVVAQMLLQHVPDAGRFGTVVTEGTRVTSFREKDAASAGHPGRVNAGIYILRREIVEAIPEATTLSLETDILQPFVASGSVRAEQAREGTYFVDIGTPESYARALNELDRARRRPALFLDRDGTLNEDAGYTRGVENLRWMPDAREAIALANTAGYFVFVVTNQAGVARGYYPESAILDFHRAMQAQLFELGAHIDAIEWCPHHAEGAVEAYRKVCSRRKPGGGMLADLIQAWPVDIGGSLMIGDSERDMAAAASVGVRGVRYAGGSLLELLSQSIKAKD